MATAAAVRPSNGPAWAACLGIVAVLFGALMAAAAGTELMAQRVIAPNSAAAQIIPADCRKDEAAQEGVSVEECELMVANVRIMIASRPSWFRSVQTGLALVGALAAVGSIFAGIALIDYRRWAPAAAALIFGTLLVLDAAEFAAALFTGPLLRAMYLWNAVVWFAVHLCLVAGAVAGSRMVRVTTAVTFATTV
jgi:hypothetical protein